VNISEIEKVTSFKWQIDCPVIKVLDIKNNKVLDEFSGEIFQKEDGELRIKAIKNGSSPLLHIGLHKAGKLIKGQYKIEAYPYSGTKPWIADVHNFYGSSGPSGSVLKARVYELHKNEDIPKKIKLPDSMTMLLKSVDSFPLLISQEYTKKVAGGTVSHSTRDKSEFSIKGLQMEFVKDNDLLKVTIRSKSKSSKYIIDDGIAKKVLNGIQFILGKRVHILMKEITNNTSSVTTLHSIKNGQVEPIRPPVSRIDINEDCLELLKTYLSYLLTTKKKSPKLPLLINSVIESAGSSLEAQCLTFTVAVEGVVNNVLSKELHVATAFSEKEIDGIKKDVTTSVKDDEKKKRVNSLIDVLNQIRAKDRLYALVGSGIIKDPLVKSWDKIRNKAAHGNLLIESEKVQEYYDHLSKTVTLFYQLVFLTIGYTGKYTDYSEYGYTDKTFTKTLKDVKS
jgi:hypothetical protein